MQFGRLFLENGAILLQLNRYRSSSCSGHGLWSWVSQCHRYSEKDFENEDGDFYVYDWGLFLVNGTREFVPRGANVEAAFVGREARRFLLPTYQRTE